MSKYLFLIFFTLGPIYWLPGISPSEMLIFKSAVFGVMCVVLVARWTKAGPRLERTPFILFLIALAALLLTSFTHGDVMGDFETMSKYVLPCLIISMLPVMGEKNVDEIMFGIRRAPYFFAIFASLVPLGIIFPELNWPNPYSEELGATNLTQSFTGFGGSRTGWSMGASLIAAAGLVNCVVGSKRSRKWSLLVLIVIGASIFVPGGRVGMLSFATMLLTIIGLGMLRRRTLKTSAVWLLLFMVTISIALSFAEDLRLDSLLSGGLAEGSTGRLEGWAIGWNAYAQNPIFGIGENAADALGQGSGYGAVHNSMLNYLLKFGLVGMLPMVAIFVWLTVRLYRMRRSALADPVVLAATLMTVSVSAAAWTEPVVVFNAYFNIVIFWFAVAAFLNETKRARESSAAEEYQNNFKRQMVLSR